MLLRVVSLLEKCQLRELYDHKHIKDQVALYLDL